MMYMDKALQTDVVIVGGGLAGSLAAAMLARQGLRVVLVDLNEVYPPGLRCEKISGRQVAMLRKSPIVDDVLGAASPFSEFWVARFGRIVEKRLEGQYGISYDALVNRVRRSIPGTVVKITGKVTAIDCSDQRQTVSLATGEVIQARLVILATGLNEGLRRSLGITREVVSKSHSVTLGFNLKPVGRSSFDFPALTYYGEHPTDRVAYITLFPIGDAMRANLMVYRPVDDLCVRALREQPGASLGGLLPGLESLVGPVLVDGPVQIRSIDLYRSKGHLQPGVVLVGDAFGTACPAAGTGTDKVYTDVIQLCNVHVAQWLKTAGMGVEKISAFYADPLKVACDRRSFNEAFRLRSASVDESLSWWVQRRVRFVGQLARGTVQQMRSRLAVRT
jgi:2-polyprenyl-6-methoxyphenol hydroxylase-like FAD-dependent oxidoreductase